jgi:hypothetical protein
MAALLKQKSKVGVATKPRKNYEHADVFKRFKQSDGSIRAVIQEQVGPDQLREQQRIKKIVKPKILEKFDDEMKKN